MGKNIPGRCGKRIKAALSAFCLDQELFVGDEKKMKLYK